MATWGLIVETTVGTGDRKHTSGTDMAHVEGSRDDALREPEARARRFTPQHPLNQRRLRLFRTTDGFDLIVDGAWDGRLTRFTVGELLHDSAAPPAEAAKPADPVPRDAVPAAPRYDADGVPVTPSWLGRDDLP
ncbi:hypothetical protein [Streptomyces sp. NPDC002537]